MLYYQRVDKGLEGDNIIVPQHEQIHSQRDDLHVCKTDISIKTRFIKLYKLCVHVNETKAVSAPGCAFDRLTK